MPRLLQPFVLTRTVTVTWSLVLVTVTVITLLLQGQALSAQDDGTATPTPAPSKTPSAEETEEPVGQGSAVAANTPFESFTQADLSVLTGNVQRPNGVAWHDGNLYAACTGDWTIYQLDATSGRTQTYIYGVRNAHTMVAETDADDEITLWVPDFQTNSLNRINRTGVTPVSTDMSGPWGITSYGPEHFLVSNLLSNNVVRIDREGEGEEVISGLMSPTGVAVDGETVYVANNGSTRRAIEWYDLSEDNTAVAQEDRAAHTLVSGLQNPTGLALGADGYLYFAYSLGTRGVVGRVNPGECRENGGCTGNEVEIVVLTELAAPLADLTISPDMRLYVHTMFSPDIYWVQLNGAEAQS